MKRTILYIIILCLIGEGGLIGSSAAGLKGTADPTIEGVPKPTSDTIATRTGWSFGALPSLAYDADYGFQGGALFNAYYYGDGSTYPDYRHSLYVEASYSTKHSGIFRFLYDTRYLWPGHHLSVDLTYLPDAMCDFYGFNGYQSIYHPEYTDSKSDSYRTRAYYKYRRDFIRFAADIDGAFVPEPEKASPFVSHLRWNAGIGVLGYILNDCDTVMLNRGKKPENRLPSVDGLYREYVNAGLITADEARGGWHPYARLGITYDSRDKHQGTSRGIYADVFFTYSAAFNAAYGQQATAGYNHLTINAAFRHYVPLYQDRVVLAYRLAIQNTIAGRSPFYMNCYLNQLFIQRMIYEGLGGGNSLRGIIRNRILADGYAYANIELRCKLVRFDLWKQHFYIGISPNFDIGVITQPMRETIASKDLYRPHMSAGLGLKAAMNENFILSVDWAMPVNDRYHMDQDNASWANFYVMMGYLF